MKTFTRKQVITAALSIGVIVGVMVVFSAPSEMQLIRNTMASNDQKLAEMTKDYNDLEKQRTSLLEEAENLAKDMIKIRDDAQIVRQEQVALQTKVNALIKGETLPTVTEQVGEGKE